MHINITDPQQQTLIFGLILFALFALTLKKDLQAHRLSLSFTKEFKGVAILMVLFSHIGYLLFSDHRFMFPLSVAGGVGVNIFLFISGFGLTSSQLKQNLAIFEFYKKRLKGIFIPMWLVFIAFLLLDIFVLGRQYSLVSVVQNLFGFFPNSDITTAVNSPLWYFTLILFYYMVFPLSYRCNKPLLSVVLVAFLGLIITNLPLPVTPDVLKLYKLHNLAFPLGMLFAYLQAKGFGPESFMTFLQKTMPTNLFRKILQYFLLLILMLAFSYLSIYSGVGESIWTEQLTSLLTGLVLVLIFLTKEVQSKFLTLLGEYSYEIYLLQWPLMFRYDLIYKYLPAYLGTLAYIALFIGIGFGMKKLVERLSKLVTLD